MLRHAMLALVVASCLPGCSTVRLTPSAARYLKDGEHSDQAQQDLDRAQQKLVSAVSQADTVLNLVGQQPKAVAQVGRILGSPGAPDIDALVHIVHRNAGRTLDVAPLQDRTQRDMRRESPVAQSRLELAQRIVNSWWRGELSDLINDDKTDVSKLLDNAFGSLFGKERPTQQPYGDPPVVAGRHRIEFLEKQVSARAFDVNQLELVESGQWEYFVDGSVYFSIEPLIAIRPDLKAVAIPSIAVNWRPFNLADTVDALKKELGGLSAVGVQLTLGGALNPGGGGDDSAGGAIGIGFSIPVASIGAFSVGAVWYSDGTDAHSAPYISLTLGDFGRATSGGP